MIKEPKLIEKFQAQVIATKDESKVIQSEHHEISMNNQYLALSYMDNFFIIDDSSETLLHLSQVNVIGFCFSNDSNYCAICFIKDVVKQHILLFDLQNEGTLWIQEVPEIYFKKMNQRMGFCFYQHSLFILGERFLKEVTLIGDINLIREIQFTNIFTRYTKQVKINENLMLFQQQIGEVARFDENGEEIPEDYFIWSNFYVFSTQSHKVISAHTRNFHKMKFISLTQLLALQQINNNIIKIFKLRCMHNWKTLRIFKVKFQSQMFEEVSATVITNHLFMSKGTSHQIINLLTGKHFIKNFKFNHFKSFENDPQVLFKHNYEQEWEKNHLTTKTLFQFYKYSF